MIHAFSERHRSRGTASSPALIPSRIAVALTAALCGILLVVSIGLAASIASHASHTHHDAQTHTQTWCGWMCQAGCAIHTPSLPALTPTARLSSIEPWAPFLVILLFATNPSSRAPPDHLLL